MKTAFAVLILCAAVLNSSAANHFVRFDNPRAGEFLSLDGTRSVYFYNDGCPVISQKGLPFNYSEIAVFEVPDGFDVLDVKIYPSEFAQLTSGSFITPNQGTYPMSFDPGKIFIEPDAEVYSRDEFMPPDPLLSWEQGSFLGEKLLFVYISPVMINPSKGIAHFAEEMEIEIQYTPSSLFRRASSPQDTVMAIITSQSYASQADSLKRWHNKRGINTAVGTLQSISASFPGRDTQEKIRNYIKKMHDDYGCQYVLLLGSWSDVPGRYCRVSLQSLTEDIPTDLYYSDLDGTWDFNSNNIFGEPGDSLDLFPDVSVGRAAVVSSAEAWTFVSKTISYSQNNSLSYIPEIYLVASYLDYRTDGGEAKDAVSQMLIPSEFSVNKLYERLGNLNVSTFVNSVSADGFSFMNHIGHGSSNALQCGADYLSYSDINLLSNGTKLGTVYSTSCLSSSFDGDCIGWTFLSNPNGGSVSYIGNSRYGWYTPGFPGSGTSDVMDYKFYETVFGRGEDILGRAFGFHKAIFVGLAGEQNDYRWLMFALTLFGDPSLRMWTSTQIAAPSVEIPQGSFPSNGGTIPVSVRDGSGEPLDQAIVTLSSQGRIMSFGITGTSGNILLQYDSSFATQGVLCVWGKNIMHYERGINFAGADYRLQVDSVVLLDTGYSNNFDRFFSSGETTQVTVFVKNTGTQPMSQLTAFVSSSNPGIGAVKSADTLSSLNAGASAPLDFILGASPAVLDTSGARIVLSLEASSYADSFSLPIDIENPDMKFIGFRIEDTISGDGDGYLEPGETAVVKFIFENGSRPSLFEGLTTLRTPGSDLTVIDSLFDHQTVAQGDTAVFNFIIRAEASALSGSVYEASLVFKSGELTLPVTGEAQIKIGQFGFYDDMESGQGGWTASGTQNLWHLSQERSHSPSHSWYCGNDGTHTYPPDFTDTLESPYFETCPDMYLSFWHFYATEAGYDYCLVQQLTGDGWISIMTFSGFSNEWVREIYPLDASQDSTKIRFVFYSEDNQNQYEGWYIDDVEIYGSQTVEVEEEVLVSVPQIRYSGSFITPDWKIMMSSAGNEFVNILIYDISGRQVQVIYEGVLPRGEHSFSMPSDIPAGVYFLKVSSGALREETKLIKTR